MNDATVFIIMAFVIGLVMGGLVSLLLSLNKGLVLSKLHKSDADMLREILVYTKTDISAMCRNKYAMNKTLGTRFISWREVNVFIDDMRKLLRKW